MARRSVTPADEGCQAVMTARLAALGFKIEPLRYGNVENFWATPRAAAARCSALRGTPTSCRRARWRSGGRDPFVPTIRDGVLYGRGAADMKSGLAAMVTATEEFVRSHPQHKGTIAFLITSDEEGPSVDGTKRVAEMLAGRQRAHRLVRGGRALERGRSSATRSRSAGAGPSAGGSRFTACRGTSPIRSSRKTRCIRSPPRSPSSPAACGTTARSTSSPRPSRSRISTPAPARPM